MRFKRNLVLLSAFAAVSVAHAQYSSPELMMVFDGGSDTSPAKIDRYDPINRQYLGSFGTGFIPQKGTPAMAVMGQNVYLLSVDYGTNTSAVIGFNFSTGALVYSHAVAGAMTGMAVSNGKAFLAGYGSSSVDMLDLSSGAESSFTNPFGDTNILAVSASKKSLGFVSFAGDGTAHVQDFALDGSGNIVGTRFGASYATGSLGFTISSAFTTDASGNEDFLVGGETSVFGGINKYGVTGALLDSSGVVRGGSGVWIDNNFIATGHNGATYFLRSNNQVAYLNSDLPYSFSGTGDPAFNLSNTATGTLIAVYAAPEPPAFLILGLGFVPLLLKSRRKK